MRALVIAGTTILSAVLIVLGMLYIIDKKEQKKIGGRLIKVHYRFSKDFS
ncbi:MAG: stress-responsive transcriptional regulator PspC [Eubacteriales bacterium]